jgi:hypothetical protein
MKTFYSVLALILITSMEVSAQSATAPQGAVKPAPTPLKITSFNGSISDKKILLDWSVTENETGAHFELEKSFDGKNFETSAVVLISNKTGIEKYAYQENAEFKGTVYYRVKMVNRNMSFYFSRILVMRQSAEVIGNGLNISQNPVSATLAFSFLSATQTESIINLYSLSGIRIYSTKYNSRAGSNAVSFNLESKVLPGAYLLEVISGSQRSTAKLIKN